MSNSPDNKELEEWIADIQQGDTGRYALIVAAFQQPMYRYCCRLLANRQDAEDAVQDVLVKAYQSIHRYKPTVHFSAWLYRIAYNHCLNLLRRRRLHRQVMRIFRPETVAASPEQELDALLYKPSLAAALSRLSLEERNLLILRVFEEKSYEELSEILKITPNALNKRMARIKKKVKLVMESEEEEQWNEPQSAMNTKI
ncbi:RNA polymerase sigma factor [Paenibacillus albidus]|uniref:RNA polymerase sigma factor n=1 Tax=Paenibacillus albidus TaxID=2041023 RepID=A0A917C0Z2_9BACL|nr:sigma-70 family RNA polymerase sigma factor [Paenibacillus albidus]GGF65379.1 RNA polymerase sigma factor [Paenibacillus albidus]